MAADPRLIALGYAHVYEGKVRDLYTPPGDLGVRYLMVASDRVSAFDHVLDPAIPGKGAALNELSRWWFTRIPVPNDNADGAVDNSLVNALPDDIALRSRFAYRLDMRPVECVARGYLVGSGWAEYQQTQSVCGVELPAGLGNGDRLPEPIYTPAYKAPVGEHDENIPFEKTVELVGESQAIEMRHLTLEIYRTGAAIAEERGLILADTKVEFGLDLDTGELNLADELLTSDSSRYWDRATYDAGGPGRLASFDKQIVRDWLSANWDKTGTPPALPPEIVERTAAKYRELIERLTS